MSWHCERKELWVLILLFQVLSALAYGQPPSTPQPAIIVSFDRSAIREGDTIRGLVRIANNSGVRLNDLRLEVNHPSFFTLYWSPLRPGDVQPLSLPDLDPYSTSKPLTFALALLPKSAQMGEFNVLVTLTYSWKENGVTKRSLVTSEKAIQVDWLGTDKVVGIPVAFAGFVVPGLFFLLVLRFAKITMIRELQTDEKIMLSIMISVFCMGILLALGKAMGGQAGELLNIGKDISISKLFTLSLTAVVLGLMIVAIHAVIEWKKKKAKQKLVISPNDSYLDVIEKTLKINPDYRGQPVLMELEDARKYIGSHWCRSDDSYFLTGSFKIDAQEITDDTAEQLKAFEDHTGLVQESKKLLDALREVGKREKLAKKNEKILKVRKQVVEVIGGKEVYGEPYQRFPVAEFKSVIPWPTKNMELLTLE